MLYLTARAIGMSESTRKYIKELRQSGISLPDAPVITSSDEVWTALSREVIKRQPQLFKIPCLTDIRN